MWPFDQLFAYCRSSKKNDDISEPAGLSLPTRMVYDNDSENSISGSEDSVIVNRHDSSDNEPLKAALNEPATRGVGNAYEVENIVLAVGGVEQQSTRRQTLMGYASLIDTENKETTDAELDWKQGFQELQEAASKKVENARPKLYSDFELQLQLLQQNALARLTSSDMPDYCGDSTHDRSGKNLFAVYYDIEDGDIPPPPPPMRYNNNNPDIHEFILNTYRRCFYDGGDTQLFKLSEVLPPDTTLTHVRRDVLLYEQAFAAAAG